MGAFTARCVTEPRAHPLNNQEGKQHFLDAISYRPSLFPSLWVPHYNDARRCHGDQTGHTKTTRVAMENVIFLLLL